MSHEPEPCWVVTADLHVQMDSWVRRAAGHSGFLTQATRPEDL